MAKSVATKRRKSQRNVVSSDVTEQDVNTGSEGPSEQMEASTIVQGPDEKQVQAKKEKQDPQEDSTIEVKGSKVNVTVSWDEKKKEGEAEDVKMGQSDQKVDVAPAVKRKRKADSTTESKIKKAKFVRADFCVYVGNLDKSKTFDEVKGSLASYLMTKSLLVQDIRLDQSRTHAHVNLASELDVTKALTLNGEQLLDKTLRIEKAKVKAEVKPKVKPKKKKSRAMTKEKRDEKNTRTLFLKNVPFSATKEDILKFFPEALDVSFPSRTKGPCQGLAFVEFKDKDLVTSLLKDKQEVKMEDRVLIVASAGPSETKGASKTNGSSKTSKKKAKVNDENKKTKTKAKPAAAAKPNNMLYLSKMSSATTGKSLKKLFPTAVNITLPRVKGKSRGFAFIEFATEQETEQALESSQNAKLDKKSISVQKYDMLKNAYKTKVLSKTLIVMGLAEQTTTETLKKAFDGAVAARIVAKNQGVKQRFGYVDFDTEENCKAGKDAIEDCEIDGNKVCVAFARRKGVKPPPGTKKSPLAPSAGKPAGQKPTSGVKGGVKGKKGGAKKTVKKAVK